MVGETIGTILILIGLLLFVVSFIGGLFALLNVRGFSDKLFERAQIVPGFRSGRRWKAAIATVVYLGFISVAMMSVGATMIPPDQIETRESSLSPNELPPDGGTVEISAMLVNNGNETETLRVDLLVDEEAVEGQEVSIPPGEERKIRFTREIRSAGEYKIELAPEGWDTERVGTLRVDATPTPTPSPTATTTLTPTAIPTATATATATPEPELQHDYTVIEVRDVSYSTVVRIVVIITPDESLGEFSRDELLLFAKDIVNSMTSEMEVNAIAVSFFEDESDYGPFPHCVGIDWAPYGEWGQAHEVETGDYEEHRYKINDNRDAENYSWCDEPNE